MNVYGEMAKNVDASGARPHSREDKEISDSGHLCHENYVSSSIQWLFFRIEPRTTEPIAFYLDLFQNPKQRHSSGGGDYLRHLTMEYQVQSEGSPSGGI
jgi:hypothetical protein